MANYTKISNGQTLTECELYEYLNTTKGYCCEKGWLWRNDDTLVEHTGRQWKVIWATDPPWECVPIFSYTSTISRVGNLDVSWYIGNSLGLQFEMYVDWGDGNVEYFSGNVEYTTAHTYSVVGTYNVLVYVSDKDIIENLDFSNFAAITNSITSFEFNQVLQHMMDSGGSLYMRVNYLPSSDVNGILCYFNSNGSVASTIDLSSQDPPAPPTGIGITCYNDLITAGNTVTTDLIAPICSICKISISMIDI